VSDYLKVALLHEDGSWREALFRVPDGEGDAFERVRESNERLARYRKIVKFVEFGEPDDDDLTYMEPE